MRHSTQLTEIIKICTIIFMIFISPVFSACKTGEGDPWAPHPNVTQRVYRHDPPNPSLDVCILLFTIF